MVHGMLDRIDHVVGDHSTSMPWKNPGSWIRPAQRRQLAEIRRQAIALRRFPPARGAEPLAAIPPPASEQNRLQLREEYDRQTRIVEDLERGASVRRSAGVTASLMAEQTMAHVPVVVLSAIFLPVFPDRPAG
jgi:hypothetical protein